MLNYIYWLVDAGLVNIVYNNIGLGQKIDNNTLKCYMFDTGLLLSITFNEKEICIKILFDKLTFSERMSLENVVFQMFVSSGRKLYFFSKTDREDADNNITLKHIIPIEVKSGERYTYSSLSKLKSKYSDYLGDYNNTY